MVYEVSSSSSSPSMISLQSAFEVAILGFIFGPPDIEEEAWKKIKDIIGFASNCKPLGESDHDD